MHSYFIGGLNISISIAICTYGDNYEVLAGAIDSIRNQLESFAEILIIFEGEDEHFEKIQAHLLQYPSKIVIHRLENQKGLSHARNLAIEKCKSNWLVFIDDDARLNPGYGKALHIAIEEFPESVGFTGPILPQYSLGTRILPKEMEWLISCNTEERNAQPVRNGFGANMAFNNSLIKSANLTFSTNLGWTGGMAGSTLAGEENEFSERLSSFHNSPIYWIPSLSVNHMVPKSRTSLAYVWKRSLKEGRTKAHLSSSKISSNLDKEYGHLIRTVLISIPKEIIFLPFRPSSASWNIFGISLMVLGTGSSFLKWKFLNLIGKG